MKRFYKIENSISECLFAANSEKHAAWVRSSTLVIIAAEESVLFTPAILIKLQQYQLSGFFFFIFSNLILKVNVPYSHSSFRHKDYEEI